MRSTSPDAGMKLFKHRLARRAACVSAEFPCRVVWQHCKLCGKVRGMLVRPGARPAWTALPIRRACGRGRACPRRGIGG